MENKTFSIVTFAVLIEAIITYFNEFFTGVSFSWEMIASLVLGIAVAIAYKLDLPAYLNLKSEIPYIGCILTGILLSRGSNYVFEIIKKLSSV